MQDRTITVRGVGTTKVAPDRVVLDFTIVNKSRTYAEATEQAAKRVHALSTSVVEAGFEAKDLKTKTFNVNATYRSERKQLSDGSMDYQQVFDGYKCSYELKLEFPLDKQTLGRVMSKLSASPAEVSIELSFTVSDPSAVRNEILRLAAINAREKAEALTGALGAKLGALQSIEYNWKDIILRSDTSRFPASEMLSERSRDELEPDDITASDSATFVWTLD